MPSKPFRLQRLLELRTRQEDACKSKLADAARKLCAAEDAVNAVEERSIKLTLDWQNAALLGLSAWQAMDYQNELLNQAHAKCEALLEVERARKEVATARVELEQAMIRVKTLEKSRERAIRRAEAEDLRKEQLQMDEHSMLMEARA